MKEGKRRSFAVSGIGGLAVAAVLLSGCSDSERGVEPNPGNFESIAYDFNKFGQEIDSQSRMIISKYHNLSERNSQNSNWLTEAARENKLFEEARELSLGKISFLYHFSSKLIVEDAQVKNPNTLILFGKEFDMKNKQQAVMANTIVDGMFYKKFNGHQGFALRDTEVVKWMANNFSLETSNTPPILPLPDLEMTARILKATSEKGLKIPPYIKVVNEGSQLPESDYKGLIMDYDEKRQTLLPRNLEYGILLESGLLEKYKIIDKNIDAQTAVDFLHQYLYYGDTQRARMLTLKLIRFSEGIKNDALYKMTFETLKVEFAGDGKAYPKKRTISEYRIGDTIEIDDWERPNYPYILLRDENLKPIPGLSIGDGEKAEVLEGPHYKQDKVRGFWETKEYYLIRPKSKIDSGLVDSEWFGNPTR